MSMICPVVIEAAVLSGAPPTAWYLTRSPACEHDIRYRIMSLELVANLKAGGSWHLSYKYVGVVKARNRMGRILE